MKRVGEEISATDRCATQADMGNSAFSAKALAPPRFPPPPSCCVCVCRFFAPTCARDSFFFFFISLRHSSRRFAGPNALEKLFRNLGNRK